MAGLNLDDMDLAVLSACQTGLGEAAAGEGVFGLQRAFHIGGARNVVASLWTVDDDATAALMNLFYNHLWDDGEPPLEALHRRPVGAVPQPRGHSGRWRKASAHRTGSTPFRWSRSRRPTPRWRRRASAAVQDWAAFVLSGAGR